MCDRWRKYYQKVFAKLKPFGALETFIEESGKELAELAEKLSQAGSTQLSDTTGSQGVGHLKTHQRAKAPRTAASRAVQA